MNGIKLARLLGLGSTEILSWKLLSGGIYVIVTLDGRKYNTVSDSNI